MNRVLNVARMHLLDRWSFIYIPLLIFIGAWILSAIISFSINVASNGEAARSGELAFNGSSQSLFWTLLSITIVAVTRTFPFSFALSITRKTYFLGTSTLLFSYSAIVGLLLAALAQLELATDSFGMGNLLSYLNIPFVTDSTFPSQWLSFFAILAFFLNTGFWIGSLFKRFAVKGLLLSAIIFVVLVAAFVIITGLTSNWPTVGGWFAALTPVKISLGLIGIAIVESVSSWLFLRGATP